LDKALTTELRRHRDIQEIAEAGTFRGFFFFSVSLCRGGECFAGGVQGALIGMCFLFAWRIRRYANISWNLKDSKAQARNPAYLVDMDRQTGRITSWVLPHCSKLCIAWRSTLWQ
jgi:hypothetical protein